MDKKKLFISLGLFGLIVGAAVLVDNHRVMPEARQAIPGFNRFEIVKTGIIELSVAAVSSPGGQNIAEIDHNLDFNPAVMMFEETSTDALVPLPRTQIFDSNGTNGYIIHETALPYTLNYGDGTRRVGINVIYTVSYWGTAPVGELRSATTKRFRYYLLQERAD